MPSGEIDLDLLEAAAKAATPGPWESSALNWRNEQDENNHLYITGGRHVAYTDDDETGAEIEDGECSTAVAIVVGTKTSGPSTANAAFITAANPQTILALTRELRELRQEEEEDAALIAALRKDNEALRAELREYRQAEEIQMRRGWTVKSWVPGTPGAKRRFGVADEHGEWVHGDEYWKHSTFTPKAALIAANEWMKQQEKGGA